MKKIFFVIDKVIEWIEILACAIPLIIITVLIFLQVVMRYFFSVPLPWAEEVLITSVIYMSLIGSSRAVRLKEHTEVNGVANALPNYARISLRFITNMITLAVLVLTVFASFVLAGRINNTSLMLKYPLKVNYYGIAIGAILMFYEYIKLLKSRILR